MRILITTGIFAPESGGPATYAPQLAAGLIKAGHSVTVMTFSSQKTFETDSAYTFKLIRIVRKSRLLNRLIFLKALLECIKDYDLVYTLDWFAVGLPVLIATSIYSKPYIVRVGGDYIWEQMYLPSGATPVSLSEFYEKGMHKKTEFSLAFFLVRLVLSNAKRVIFNSDTQRVLYEKHYALTSAKLLTIFNPVPEIVAPAETITPPSALSTEFVYWGRLIVMKNISTLLKAFAVAHLPEPFRLTIIGDGPEQVHLLRLVEQLKLEKRVTMIASLPQKEVFARVQNMRAFVLPSWTDISPNQVSEALALGLPGLVTHENYLQFHDQIPAMINPAQINDVVAKLLMLADDSQYANFKQQWKSISYTLSWNDVIKSHLQLFEEMSKSV